VYHFYYHPHIREEIKLPHMNTEKKIGQKIGDGATAEIFAYGENQVLKLFNANQPQEWIGQEEFFARVAFDHGLPVPRVSDLLEVDGRIGILFDRVVGPTAGESMGKNPLRLSRWVKMLAELLASIHSVDLSGVKIDNNFLMQKFRFERFIGYAEFWSDEQKRKVIEGTNNLPDGNSLCHGDLHPGNIIMSANGPVIIDWPAASRGNPWGDVAMTSALLLNDPYPESTPVWVRAIHKVVANRLNRVFLKAYLAIRPDTENQLKKWLVCGYAARIGDMFQGHNPEIPEKQTMLLSFIEKHSYLLDQ